MYSAEAGCFQKSEFHLGMAKIQVELVTCLDKKRLFFFFSMFYCCRVVFFKGLPLLRVNRNKGKYFNIYYFNFKILQLLWEFYLILTIYYCCGVFLQEMRWDRGGS